MNSLHRMSSSPHNDQHQTRSLCFKAENTQTSDHSEDQYQTKANYNIAFLKHSSVFMQIAKNMIKLVMIRILKIKMMAMMMILMMMMMMMMLLLLLLLLMMMMTKLKIGDISPACLAFCNRRENPLQKESIREESSTEKSIRRRIYKKENPLTTRIHSSGNPLEWESIRTGIH